MSGGPTRAAGFASRSGAAILPPVVIGRPCLPRLTEPRRAAQARRLRPRRHHRRVRVAGAAKQDHIAALTALSCVAAAERDRHGRAFAERDLDALRGEFIPLQLEVLPDFSKLIPGTVKAVAALRAVGLVVAATTSYDTAMTRIVTEAAARQGFVPDAVVHASDVAAGRPAFWRPTPRRGWCGRGRRSRPRGPTP